MAKAPVVEEETDERSLAVLLYGDESECEHIFCHELVNVAATNPACHADHAVCCSCCL
jgi:hypothetical protein